jgi:hypothetical protein
VKRKRIAPEQRAVLLAAFAADPRPSVAAREALAAQTGLELGTTSNWFDAERKRSKAAQPPAAEGAEVAPAAAAAAEGDSPAPAAPAAMRKRKPAAYEAPVDDAGREALLTSLAAEEAALAAALNEPSPDLFALLPASQLSAAAQPLLNRAVRGLGARIARHAGHGGLRARRCSSRREKRRTQGPKACRSRRALPRLVAGGRAGGGRPAAAGGDG